jgi:hypothetical protein
MFWQWWDNLRSETRKQFADWAAVIGSLIIDLIIAMAFPKLELYALYFLGLLCFVGFCLREARGTKMYRDLTR